MFPLNFDKGEVSNVALRLIGRSASLCGRSINCLVMSKSLMSFFKKILVLALFVAAVPAFAQGSFTVKLKLVDANTNEAVGFATTSLTVKGEKEAEKFALTNSEGKAEIAKVKKGTYIFKAEIMGYKAFEKEIVIEKNMDLGDIKMEEDIEVLEAAKVTDVGNPITVKKDTIEYNASSFKTSDNDMLEDLLKKLPGVEVNSDGSITANGETISKITIEEPSCKDDRKGEGGGEEV